MYRHDSIAGCLRTHSPDRHDFNSSNASNQTSNLPTYMWAARRVRLWRPLPPTPRSSPLPRGWRMMRAIRQRCRIASMKRTRFMVAVFIWLYSSRKSFNALIIYWKKTQFISSLFCELNWFISCKLIIDYGLCSRKSDLVRVNWQTSDILNYNGVMVTSATNHEDRLALEAAVHCSTECLTWKSLDCGKIARWEMQVPKTNSVLGSKYEKKFQARQGM